MESTTPFEPLSHNAMFATILERIDGQGKALQEFIAKVDRRLEQGDVRFMTLETAETTRNAQAKSYARVGIVCSFVVTTLVSLLSFWKSHPSK